jgi:PTS system nitrogen regulatory IIA component
MIEVLHADGILLRQSHRTFDEAIAVLVDNLVMRRRVPRALREAAIGAVCEREHMASTAIVEIGVSVPHARLPGIAGVVGAVAASPTAVYYATERVPISIVALILSPPDRAAEHLNALASLSLLLQSESVRRTLREATDPSAAIAAIGTPTVP